MAFTPDDLLGKLNNSIYLLRSMELNNITPFTYKDGLTYYDVLQRLRTATLEVIKYVSEFGKEQERLTGDYNKTVTRFIADMEKRNADWGEDVIRKGHEYVNDMERKRNEILTQLNDLKNHIARHTFTTRQWSSAGAGVADIPTEGNDHLSVATEQSLNVIGDFITRLNAADKALENKLKNVYTKNESNDTFALKNPTPICVVIGTSNAVPGTHWTKKVCDAMGWIEKNYAIGGGSITGAQAGSFDQQIENAHNGLTADENSKVEYLFIGDMLNDIRANASITRWGAEALAKAKRYWPNAKIICVPVFFNRSSLNNQFYMWHSAALRTAEMRDLLLPYGGIIAEGSRSWYRGSTDVGENWVRGSDEVHLTDAGYDDAARRTIAWLRGNTSWKNYPPTRLDNYGLDNYGVNKNDMWLYVSTSEGVVTVNGSLTTNRQINEGEAFWSFPSWASSRAYEHLFFPIMGRNAAREWRWFEVDGGTQQLKATEQLAANTTYMINMSYNMW